MPCFPINVKILIDNIIINQNNLLCTNPHNKLAAVTPKEQKRKLRSFVQPPSDPNRVGIPLSLSPSSLGAAARSHKTQRNAPRTGRYSGTQNTSCYTRLVYTRPTPSTHALPGPQIRESRCSCSFVSSTPLTILVFSRLCTQVLSCRSPHMCSSLTCSTFSYPVLD